MDFLTKPKRSALMATIRGRHNKSTELALLKLFRIHRITGWRRHVPLPGRPDFVFRGPKVALFVDGCFWHGCPRCYRRPTSNPEFWNAKVTGNRKRDRRVARELRAAGWKVLRIWEHELTKGKDTCLKKIRLALSIEPSKATVIPDSGIPKEAGARASEEPPVAKKKRAASRQARFVSISGTRP